MSELLAKPEGVSWFWLSCHCVLCYDIYMFKALDIGDYDSFCDKCRARNDAKEMDENYVNIVCDLKSDIDVAFGYLKNQLYKRNTLCINEDIFIAIFVSFALMLISSNKVNKMYRKDKFVPYL